LSDGWLAAAPAGGHCCLSLTRTNSPYNPQGGHSQDEARSRCRVYLQQAGCYDAVSARKKTN